MRCLAAEAAGSRPLRPLARRRLSLLATGRASLARGSDVGR